MLDVFSKLLLLLPILWPATSVESIKCGDKYLYTFTYVQYKQKYTKICPHTLILLFQIL